MAYHYEQERRRLNPADPYSGGRLRPHEFPSRGETGWSGIAVALVILTFIGLVVIGSTFTGGPPGADTSAPAAAVPDPASTD